MSLSQRIVDFLRENPESSAAEIGQAIDDIQDGDHAARLLHGLFRAGKVLRGTDRPYRYVCADDPALVPGVAQPTKSDQPQRQEGPNRPQRDIGPGPSCQPSSAEGRAAAALAPEENSSGAAFDLSEAGSRTLPPGDAIDISLDHRGTLVIATCEGELELTAEQTLALGDFLQATQGVWRP